MAGSRVLVVRMCGDHEHAADDFQLFEDELKFRRSCEITLGQTWCNVYYNETCEADD